MMLKVGQKVLFDPMQHLDGNGSDFYKGTIITGTVAMVNYAHGWFSVEYGDTKQRASFHFTDIEEQVKIVG